MNGFNYFNPARVVFGNKPYESIEAFLKESGAESLMMIHTKQKTTHVSSVLTMFS